MRDADAAASRTEAYIRSGDLEGGCRAIDPLTLGRRKFRILGRMPRYIPEGSLAAKKRIAEEIFSRCRQIEIEGAPSYKIWTYSRAGWTVNELDCDTLALYERSGLRGLRALPNI